MVNKNMKIKRLEKIKEKLKNSSVGIAGAGGLGSNVAVSLTRCGIGKLVIVDYDNVEESNLNRQYYFIDQIRRKKVDALKENLLRINPELDIIIHDEKLKKNSMEVFFNDVDVVVEALDDAKTKKQFIEEIVTKLNNKPLVGASGVAGYGDIEKIITIHDGNLHMVYNPEAESSDDDVLLTPKVCVFANWQADIVIQILLEEKL